MKDEMEKQKKRNHYKWFGIVLFLGFFLFLYLMMPKLTFVKKNTILEKGVTYDALSLVASSNGQVIPESDVVNTQKIGTYDFTYTVKKWLFSKEVVLHYEVIDTTPPDLKVIKESVELKQGASYTRQDVLRNIDFDEGEIEYQSDIDEQFPGTYRVYVTATDESGNRSEISYEVFIKDSEAPVVLNYGDGAMILRGEDFDISDIISYGDDFDPKPKIEVEGKVNTAKVGTYPLTVTLTDQAENVTSWDLDVRVVSRYPKEDEAEEEVYPFADFYEEYKQDDRLIGIDVSEWQGDIDFVKLKEAGCEFVMLRIGFSRNGTLYLDKSFKDNLAKAKSVGMPLGVYYYSNDKSAEEVRSVFRQIVSELGDTRLELPVVFDWENFMDFQYYEISLKDLDHMYQVFEEEAEKMGYTPMLYGSKYYLENLWRKTDKRTIWLAHYTDWSSYEGKYKLWQTCAWGQVDGIEENVDFDVLFLD